MRAWDRLERRDHKLDFNLFYIRIDDPKLEWRQRQLLWHNEFRRN